jgi:hypothetical protein
MKNRASLMTKYGDPIHGGPKWWAKWGAKTIVGPEFEHVTVLGKKWKGVIWCHIDIRTTLEETFRQIAQAGLAKEIHTYDGCYALRSVRGGHAISIHSWGYAIDINAAENHLGAKPKMSPALVAIFKTNGWTWGGDWDRPDGMHFQMVEEG